jgi:hypothetical protein
MPENSHVNRLSDNEALALAASVSPFYRDATGALTDVPDTSVQVINETARRLLADGRARVDATTLSYMLHAPRGLLASCLGAFLNRCDLILNSVASIDLLAVAAFNHLDWLVQRLVDAGVPAGGRTSWNSNPLGELTICSRPSHGARHATVLKCLLEAGADPNAPDGEGITPLGRETRNSQTRGMRLLIAAGARAVLAEDEGRSPACFARLSEDRTYVSRRRSRLVQSLLAEAQRREPPPVAKLDPRDYATEAPIGTSFARLDHKSYREDGTIGFFLTSESARRFCFFVHMRECIVDDGRYLLADEYTDPREFPLGSDLVIDVVRSAHGDAYWESARPFGVASART